MKQAQRNGLMVKQQIIQGILLNKTITFLHSNMQIKNFNTFTQEFRFAFLLPYETYKFKYKRLQVLKHIGKPRCLLRDEYKQH